MVNYPQTEELYEKFGKYAKTTGVVFIVLGLIGILFPVFMTVAVVSLVSWLMLFAGIVTAFFTWVSNKQDFSGWLKSFVLIFISLFIIFYPMAGASTVGILLAIYFLMDGFSGLSLALSMRPNKGWMMWMINAILSFLIGGLFIIGWPFSSMSLIGLLVGFSLFFDGISLVSGGSIIQKLK